MTPPPPHSLHPPEVLASVPHALLEPSTTEESTATIADGVEKVFEEEEVNLMAATMPLMDSQLTH